MDIAALAAEIASGHPGTGAYDADDATAAGQLNAVNRTMNKATMTGSEVFNSVDAGQWSGLTDADKQIVWDIVHLGTINPFGVEQTIMVSVFGATSATITALAAARVNNVSRAMELGLGYVRAGNVGEARS